MVTVGGISTPEGAFLVTPSGERIGSALVSEEEGKRIRRAKRRRGGGGISASERARRIREAERQKLISEIEEERLQNLPELRKLTLEQLKARREKIITRRGTIISRIEELKGQSIGGLREKKLAELETTLSTEQFLLARKETRIKPSIKERLLSRGIFVKSEGGKDITLNIGGGVRKISKGFEKQTSKILEASLLSGQRLGTGALESRPSLLGSEFLGRQKARFQSLAFRKADVGQIGVELFFTPIFSMESSITKLAQPKRIFRQAVPKPKIIQKQATIGKSVITETKALTPARFETRASPLEELFGEFKTVKISPRRTTSVVSIADVSAKETFAGFAGRKIITGKKERGIELFLLKGGTQKIPFIKGKTLFEERAFRTALGKKKGQFISIAQDVKFFRGETVGKKLFEITRGGKLKSSIAGKKISRGAGITGVKQIGESGRVFGTVSGFADISKSIRGGAIRRTKGISVIGDVPSREFISGRRRLKTSKDFLVSKGVQLKEFGKSLTKQIERPKVKQITKPKVISKKPTPILSQRNFFGKQKVVQLEKQRVQQLEGIKIVDVGKLRQTPKQITKIKTRQKFGVTGVIITTPTQIPRQIPRQIPKTSPITISRITPKQPKFPKGISFFPLSKPFKSPKTPSPKIPIALPLSLSFVTDGKKREFGAAQIFKEVPSFKALAFDITGKKKSRGISGLQFAPIPKGFSFAKLFGTSQKRKKGGKK